MYADRMSNKKYSVNNTRGGARKSWPMRNNKHTWKRGGTDSDGDTEMSDGNGANSRYRRGGPRFNPGYARNKNRPNRSGWFKIIVHHADKFSKEDLFTMLDKSTNEHLDPQCVDIERNKLIFFLKNPRTKEIIEKQNGKMIIKDHTISMFAVPSAGPSSRISKEDLKVKICASLAKRYSNGCLSLKSFDLDEDLRQLPCRVKIFEIGDVLGALVKEKCADILEELDLSENKLYSTKVLMPIIKECKVLKRLNLNGNLINQITQLHSLKMSAPQLTHLSLINNPIKNVMETVSYVNEIRKFFPNLISLDGTDLPERVTFDEETSSLPPVKKFGIPLEPALRSKLESFFSTFVKVHDQKESRGELIHAYHDSAIFSISASWTLKKDALSNRDAKFPTKAPTDIAKRNRNFRYITADQREKRLFVGKETIVKEISLLAPTKHIYNSMNIDTSTVTGNCVTAIISGLIDCDDSYRTFSRSLILVPGNNAFLILNDQLSICRSRKDYVDEMSKVVPTTAASTHSTSDQEKQQLLNKLQAATRMKNNYCIDCLNSVNWKYEDALKKFTELKSKLPPDAIYTRCRL